MTDTVYRTQIFRIPASVYLKTEARDFAFKWGWVLVVPVAATCAAGCCDARFFLVALMLLFVVIPPVIAMVYFHRLLSPEARDAISAKAVSVIPGASITVEHYTTDPEEDSPPQLIGSTVIDWESIRSVSIGTTHTTLRLKGRELPLIIETDDSFPAAEIFASKQENH